jgi:tetratricopeptide (TPR) repeat protein
LSQKYGFPIEILEQFLNALGYQLVAQGNINKAIVVFEDNVGTYPNSAHVYDSLGEALETNNQFDLSLNNYKKAVEIGKTNSDPNTRIYLDHIERVKNKLNKY